MHPPAGLRWGGPSHQGDRDLPYAPGLDGIRAIAVAAVVLYHGRVPWLPGGFLGVDIFFVLSGYLITSLLLAEFRRSGAVDLRRFWMARVRRLLPAAVLVILVCLIVVTAFYPSDLTSLRADALASLLYVNNWHQILVHHSYFASFSRPSLLQHYWSLAVEEQFYLVWPILLVIGLTRLPRRWLLAATACVALASAVLMAILYHPGSDPSRVYYGTDTRATPLMVGALLAFAWPLGQMTARTVPRARFALDGAGVLALGLLVLIMSSWHDYDSLPYRGGFVIVALLAAVVIAVASHPASSFARLLGRQPLRWVGQRSYGIYLWHWPVMALTRPDIDLHWSLWVLLPAQVIVTLALAEFSYRFVEMPIRHRRAWVSVRAWLDERQPTQRLLAVSGATVGSVAVIVTVGFLPLATSSEAHQLPLRSAAAATPAAQLKPVTPPETLLAPTRDAAAATAAGVGGPRPPAGTVLAVGASVMLAAAPELEQRLGARVDAAVGREPSAILSRLQAYHNAHALPPYVIVQIGDNGPLWSADAARLRTVLSGVPHVVLVNIREPGVSWQDEVNNQLTQVTQSWPQARVANWQGASGNPRLTYDGAHPDPAGGEVYAGVVALAMGYGPRPPVAERPQPHPQPHPPASGTAAGGARP